MTHASLHVYSENSCVVTYVSLQAQSKASVQWPVLVCRCTLETLCSDLCQPAVQSGNSCTVTCDLYQPRVSVQWPMPAYICTLGTLCSDLCQLAGAVWKLCSDTHQPTGALWELCAVTCASLQVHSGSTCAVICVSLGTLCSDICQPTCALWEVCAVTHVSLQVHSENSVQWPM